MSIIVVKVFPKKIQIGADSQITHGGEKRTGAGEHNNDTGKIFKISSNWIFGGVGFSRENQFMREFCGTRHPSDSSEGAMTSFYEGFIEFAGGRINKPYYSYNDFLMVYGERVYLLQDYRASEITAYEAIGSGKSYALGALRTMSSSGSIKPALSVACEYDLHCHEPLTVFEIRIKKKDDEESDS